MRLIAVTACAFALAGVYVTKYGSPVDLRDKRVRDGVTAASAQALPRSTIGVLKADPRDPNRANRMIMALNEDERRSFFYGQLGYAGERCPTVTRTFYQGSAKPSWNAIWNVACSDGAPSYVVWVASDEGGSAKVLTCGELRSRGGGECFVRRQ
jgi:hypothetical protein